VFTCPCISTWLLHW